ncbi:potassium channel family protein [Cumulibacter soli]|uniref:potassium channel family protein n=1 Tax=Cumulibacter soli TaxID=2546344 RepID=UPI0010678F96|nr:TrkA family potassium uptake protein [Cumulibacter soli]
MRVAIAGAGAVGRSIALELTGYGHKVLLIERDASRIDPEQVPDAEWVHADACELSVLEEIEVQRCPVVIAATGDDKVNLVVSLLSKTEFGVGRVVARINDPTNEWLFNEAWGVDIAVSTPRVLAALVEEAVTVGDLVRIMRFRSGETNLVEITLGSDHPLVGSAVRSVQLPRDTALVTILRGDRVIVPVPDEPLEADDELLFVANESAEDDLRALMAQRRRG